MIEAVWCARGLDLVDGDVAAEFLPDEVEVLCKSRI
jgi:hypothetical protein